MLFEYTVIEINVDREGLNSVQIEIIKCHGSNNDFILIDEYSNDYGFNDEQRTILTRELCDRSKIIGADGVLFVQKSDVADAKMRIFNADGSEPEMCGNGLRCAGRYIIELLKKDKIIVETLKANLAVEKVEDIYEDVPSIEVGIGPVSFELDSLPMVVRDEKQLLNKQIDGFSDSFTFTAISIPNPHVIAVTDHFTEEDVKTIGQKANKDKSIFPKGVNVSFVSKLEDSKIFVQTFERGVGLTNACGTAMCASSLTTCLLGMNEFNKDITVFNKGGMVNVFVVKDGEHYEARLKGNATYEFSSTVEFSFEDPNAAEKVDGMTFEDEIANYAKLQEFAGEFVKQYR